MSNTVKVIVPADLMLKIDTLLKSVNAPETRELIVKKIEVALVDIEHEILIEQKDDDDSK